jgi:hypothetical protein
MNSIASSGVPGDYSLTATVLGNGHVSPTGTVSFLDTSSSNQVLAAMFNIEFTCRVGRMPVQLDAFIGALLAHIIQGVVGELPSATASVHLVAGLLNVSLNPESVGSRASAQRRYGQ